jgi:hypothetical protein
MSHNDDPNPVQLRRYWIRVEGRLQQGFADGIDGIEQHDDASGTTLTGTLVDMSHMFGLINHLRQLGVEIVAFDSEDVPEPDPAVRNPPKGNFRRTEE